MDKKFHTDLMILSGHTYKKGDFVLPSNWHELTSFSANNGFQATVYKNGNDIAISYRGTEITKFENNEYKKDIQNDKQMFFGKLPEQYQNANEVYQQIRHAYPNANITVTGHSLGGSLAQLVSAENGCQAVTFNAYGTGEILENSGYKNTKELNIINYGNPNDFVFSANYNVQPGRTFITNTDLNKDEIYYVQKGWNKHPSFDNHKIENMGPLEDAVEIKPLPPQYKYDVNNIHKASVNKTFTREEIANMSNEDYLKYEPQILQQLRNGQFKEQKPDYDNFVNPNTGSKKIYTKEEIAKMSADEFMKNEFEIMGQLQSIGLPDKKDLPQNSTDSDDGRWVTINGNHVFIEK